MISDVTVITPHRGLMIRDPSKAGLFLAGYEAYWPGPRAPGLPLAWKGKPPPEQEVVYNRISSRGL
jgi:hypothetical protein